MNYETTIDTNPAIFGDRDAQAAGRRRWLIIGAAVLAVAAAIALAVSFMGGAEKAPADASTQAAVVTVIAPGAGTVVETIKATGTIAARRDTPVGVVGEGGMVARILVDANSWVAQGQVLAVIERSVQVQQIAALDAQIGVARSDLRLAQNELDRASALVARGFVSKADVDRKTATRDGAAARLRATQAQAGEARARTARLDIRAPMAGVVLERNLEVGQVVGAGSGALFRMAAGGELELQARLSESDLARIGVGTRGSVVPVGSATPFTGTVWQVSPIVDPASRQGIARFALPYDKALRPGGFATVEITAGTVTAPTLPESAIQNDAKGAFVYLVGKDNKVVRRDVTPGNVTDKGVIVTAGLTGNELVVAYAGGFLNPGESVKPKLERTGR